MLLALWILRQGPGKKKKKKKRKGKRRETSVGPLSPPLLAAVDAVPSYDAKFACVDSVDLMQGVEIDRCKMFSNES
jgi:hypothetical protein